jgi:adenylate cyclase
VARTLLDTEHLALIDGGAGVSVASRDCALLPNLVRALGGRVEPSGEISVVLSGSDGASVLADLRASDAIAVVFSQPSTHRTLQLKGRGVSIDAASPADLALVRRRIDAMAGELAAVGFSGRFARGLLSFAPEDLRVVRFRPDSAFEQTPGPRAGAVLGTASKPATVAARGSVPEAKPRIAVSQRSTGLPAPGVRFGPPASRAALRLDTIRHCLEGATPAVIATCAPDGTPNVSYLSQVQYVDDGHIALSFQFFNKTRANVLANPRARLIVIDPEHGAMYRLTIRYLRTETAGPLFEHMRAMLESIASHAGMADVFRLLGADVYQVEDLEVAHGEPPAMQAGPNRLAALRAASGQIAACSDLYTLLDETLAAVHRHLAIDHSMLLLLDRAAARLYTVASRGYAASGVGSEIPLGAGVVGVAVREGTPIRLSRLTSAYAYGRAIREATAREGLHFETEIPFPGLVAPRSQLAVPIRIAGETVGALLVESTEDLRFGYDDEDALVALATLIGQTMHLLQQRDEGEAAREAGARPDPTKPDHTKPGHTTPSHTTPGSSQTALGDRPAADPVTVRHYPADNSVFLGDDYLIKGVAGAVFWALVSDHVNDGRTAFSNRELRLDPRIRLPEVGDNLEARLVLLQRRLVERHACVRIEKSGRGRFCLRVERPLRLTQVG